MSTTAQLTRDYRRQQLAERTQMAHDIVSLWPTLDPRNVDRTFRPYAIAMMALINRQRRRMSILAADYLIDFRLASGVPGDPVIVIPDPPPAAQLATSLEATGPGAIKKSMRSGKLLHTAQSDAFVQTLGASTRHAMDGARETVMQSSYADPASVGWRRVTSGGCRFCQMLADRGDVYTEGSAVFGAHDHCACSAEPVIEGTDAAEHRRGVGAYAQKRKPTDDERARLRAYLDQHYPRGGTTVEQTRQRERDTLAQLERSLRVYDAPGTRARADELRHKLAD